MTDRGPTTYQREQPETPWTADRLRKLIADMPEPIPDPLNGANTLYVHPDRAIDAERIKEAAGGRLHIQLSRLASPNVIAGFKGDECVLIIGSEKS